MWNDDYTMKYLTMCSYVNNSCKDSHILSAETNSNFYYSTSYERNDRMFDYSIGMYFYAKTFVRVQITMLLSFCLFQIL